MAGELDEVMNVQENSRAYRMTDSTHLCRRPARYASKRQCGVFTAAACSGGQGQLVTRKYSLTCLHSPTPSATSNLPAFVPAAAENAVSNLVIFGR